MLDSVKLSPDSPTPSDYVKPAITDYGDLAKLTAGLSRGSRTDAIFPVPRRDFTFSIP
jgi:hypothetical protein